MKDTITLYAIEDKKTGKYVKQLSKGRERLVSSPLDGELDKNKNALWYVSGRERIVAFKFKLVTK